MQNYRDNSIIKSRYVVFLFINDNNDRIKTGREMLSDLVCRAITQANTGCTHIQKIPKVKKSPFIAFVCGLSGWIDGLSRDNSTEFISSIRQAGATHVFIDGSNLGRLAREIKIALPEVKIFTLFHNVEFVFFRANFRRLLSARSFAVMVCNYIAERMAVKHSDTILCLNFRDAKNLENIYGKLYSKDKIQIFPMCIMDSPTACRVYIEHPDMPRFALFVGGAFYANLEGIRWYAQHVSGKINCTTYIVGKGFDAYRTELEKYQNIKVIGAVDDLGEWYKNASFVVSPIFDGSGMKTKTAEAMQFGRPVFGTDEAFVGYEEFIPMFGRVCNDASTFILNINKFLNGDFVFDTKSIRNTYHDHFSYNAALSRLKSILC